MFKIFRATLLLTLLLTAILAFSPTAWAAASTSTILANGDTVTITNNYAASDTIEITLTAAAVTQTVYWVYMPGVSTDKTAQLCSVTIKKGATTGKASISAGKLTDFTAGNVRVTMGGGNMENCNYPTVAATSLTITNEVSLRNSASGAEMLIVDKSIVTKGMIVYAVVNGKIYKGTASKDGIDIQISLPTNMEEGTVVWYTIAEAGCKDIGYSPLTLGPIQTSVLPASANIKLFYQGDGLGTSSIMVRGLNPGDQVRCYDAVSGKLLKSITVPNGNTMVFINSLKLGTSSGSTSSIDIKLTEKGKLESGATNISVPVDAVPLALKSTAVTVTNTLTGSTSAAATVTVKNVTIDDTVIIYDDKGVEIDRDRAVTDPADPTATEVDVEFTGLDLGTAATTIYLSVSSTNGESAWLKVSVTAAKAP